MKPELGKAVPCVKFKQKFSYDSIVLVGQKAFEDRDSALEIFSAAFEE